MTLGSTSQIAAPDRSTGAGPYARLVLRDAKRSSTAPEPHLRGRRRFSSKVTGSPRSPLGTQAATGSLCRTPSTDGARESYGPRRRPPRHARTRSTPTPTSARPDRSPERRLRLQAHGSATAATTIRELGAFNGLDWTVNEARRAEANEIAAPRLHIYPALRSGTLDGPSTPGHRRRRRPPGPTRSRTAVLNGVKSSAPPHRFPGRRRRPLPLLAGSPQLPATTTSAGPRRVKCADLSARLGTERHRTLVRHPEAMFRDRTLQRRAHRLQPQQTEPQRFSRGAHSSGCRPPNAAATPGRRQLGELLSNSAPHWSPTFSITTSAPRDAARVRTSEWHPLTTLSHPVESSSSPRPINTGSC